jgi:hypothetical protein
MRVIAIHRGCGELRRGAGRQARTGWRDFDGHQLRRHGATVDADIIASGQSQKREGEAQPQKPAHPRLFKAKHCWIPETCELRKHNRTEAVRYVRCAIYVNFAEDYPVIRREPTVHLDCRS